MKKLFFLSLILVPGFHSFGQTGARLTRAFDIFESDSQLKSAVSSLYVIDANSGEIVFERNAATGLATASTLKIITAASAYELLGQDFRYSTRFGIEKEKDNRARLIIFPSFDPTLGSWRWEGTKDNKVLARIVQGIQKLKLSEINGIVTGDDYEATEIIPDGWIWQDVGNYYGAGASILNWRENQFDLLLQSGNKINAPVKIVGTSPRLYGYQLHSVLRSAGKGTGDNAYIYFTLNSKEGIVRGTIPVDEKSFRISGAFPSPVRQFTATLADTLSSLKLIRRKNIQINERLAGKGSDTSRIIIVDNEVSPAMDSIIYWFLKKSINLYGEALTKTISWQKTGAGSTDNGVALIRDFWKEKGIAPTEINIVDGSGLSPLNRVTTHAQVSVLQYARKQPWFSAYYDAFPEYNGMKMKSGTINGVKGFCGYQASNDGHEYIFSFLVNNYNGPSSALVQKMYKVLDELK